jgi:predicted RNase H-like HicB family nuclease
VGTSALKRDPAGVDGEGAVQQTFRSWLESTVIDVTVRRQHDQFYAVSELFDIAGVGKTEDEALRDLAGLLDAYLRSCFNEGRSYSEAIRAQAFSRELSVRGLVGLVSKLVERVFERRRHLVLPSALRPSL